MNEHVKAVILKGFLAAREDHAFAMEAARQAEKRLEIARADMASQRERYDSLAEAIREHGIALPPEAKLDGVQWLGNAGVANGLCQQNGLLAAAQSGGFAKNVAS